MKYILFIVFLILIIPLTVFSISAYADPQCPSSQEGHLPLIKTLPIDKGGGMPGDGFENQRLTESTYIKSNSDGTIKFQYFVPTTHSGDLKVHVVWDNKVCETIWMGNYQHNSSIDLDTGVITLNVEPNKDYLIEFYPEGRANAWSGDYEESWEGTVKFYGSDYSPNPNIPDDNPKNPGPYPPVSPPASMPQIIQDNWVWIPVAGTILGIIAAITTIIKNAGKK